MAGLFQMPLAHAANPLLQNVTATPTPFYTQIPNATPTPTVILQYEFNAGGYAQVDVTEQIKDADDKIVYEFGENGKDTKIANTPGNFEMVQLNWDGKYKNGGASDGQFVPEGNYTFYVKVETASMPAAEATISIATQNAKAPVLSALSTPSPVYYTPGNPGYGINYAFAKGNGSFPIIRLKINGPMNNAPVETTISDTNKTTDGNYTITWDGLVNGGTALAGNYNYSLVATTSLNGYSVDSNPLTGSFTVNSSNQPSPVLSHLTATPTPFDPTVQTMTFGYELQGSIGFSNITAAVYNSNDFATPLKTWTFNNQTIGTNSMVWDGHDESNKQINNGAYVFKVWGSDGGFTIVPQQTSFVVVKSNVPVEKSCAGFTDVEDTDSNCAAIEYVKSIGAMTGNADGSFNQDGILQRDQIAKIVLETYKLFDQQNDYCLGKNPFPDVTEAEWSFQYICKGVSITMIKGYTGGADAGLYRPGRSVNRAEFLALLLRNLDDEMPSIESSSYSDVAVGEWFSGYAKYAHDMDLFSGSELKLTNFVNRSEVAQILYKLHQKGKI